MFVDMFDYGGYILAVLLAMNILLIAGISWWVCNSDD